MPHDHGAAHVEPDTGDRRVSIAIWANGILTVAQIVGGILSGSLALIADALHNFSDMAALVIASSMGMSRPLYFSGRFRVTMAIPPSIVVNTRSESRALIVWVPCHTLVVGRYATMLPPDENVRMRRTDDQTTRRPDKEK